MKFLVAKVFTADIKDEPGSTAENPVDLTMEDYENDKPMSTIQSLPDPDDDMRIEEGLHSDISSIHYRRPAIVSIEGITGVGKSTLMDILSQKYQDNPDVVVLKEPLGNERQPSSKVHFFSDVQTISGFTKYIGLFGSGSFAISITITLL